MAGGAAYHGHQTKEHVVRLSRRLLAMLGGLADNGTVTDSNGQ